MQVLVCVLNDPDCLETILHHFIKVGIRGATVIDSMGMAGLLNNEDSNHLNAFASIRMFLNEKHPFNKTLFVVLQDHQVAEAIQCIKREVGDINAPNVGILFTIPVNHVEGGMIEQ